MTHEVKLRERLCSCGKSLFRRGLTFGSTGNISVRLPDGGWLMTPTNVSLDDLDPGRLAKISPDGRHISGDPPTKEAFLHRSMYAQRPSCDAIVHLHSTHSVAVSCLCDIDHSNCLPPITPYYIMRVGRLPLVPYFPPGDETLAAEVERLAKDHHALLLANHGPVVGGKNISDAMNIIEELEETAKLFLLLKDRQFRALTDEQVSELKVRFPS